MAKKNYNDYMNPVQKDVSKAKQHAGAILEPSVEKPLRGQAGQNMEAADELGSQDQKQKKLRKGQNKK